MLRKNIKADFEHLRKLFILPDSQDKFIDFGRDLLDMLHEYFSEKGGIHSEISLKDLGKIFSSYHIPENPSLLKDIFPEIRKKVIKHSVKVNSPYYIGHMTSPVPYFNILIEMIIAALNQNQVKIETAKASTFVEREFVSWIHRLVYGKPESFYRKNIQNHMIALGNVTSDGTLANLTALLVARNKLFKADGKFPGIAAAGVVEAMRHYRCSRVVIFVSQRGHYSIDKISSMLGFGSSAVIKIPVDSNNKISVPDLKKSWKEIQAYNKTHKEKIMILSLIGIGGTTETGNIDDLVSLRKMANEMNTHFHVDAAWGGPVLFVDSYRHLFKGIETADSVTFDCHKLLYSPNSMGMILFRNQNDLEYIRHNSTYILRPDSVDLGRFTVEGSRPFAVLKPWTAMKVFGSSGFKVLFEYAFGMTSIFRSLIETHENFELLNNPELFILNYRFIPEEVKDLLRDASRNGNGKTLLAVNELLNDLNIALHRSIRDEDNSFVSRTVLEATKYAPQQIAVLRSIIVNPLIDRDILKEIIDEQNNLGINLYEQEFRTKLRRLVNKK